MVAVCCQSASPRARDVRFVTNRRAQLGLATLSRGPSWIRGGRGRADPGGASVHTPHRRRRCGVCSLRPGRPVRVARATPRTQHVTARHLARGAVTVLVAHQEGVHRVAAPGAGQVVREMLVVVGDRVPHVPVRPSRLAVSPGVAPMLSRSAGVDSRKGDKWSQRTSRSGPSAGGMVRLAQASSVRMARRVANQRHRTDIASPKTSVAVSTLLARTTAPRAGTESGSRVRSPRPVTDETRPR